MRIVVVFFLCGLMQSALAITKCEINGKIIYKRGICPVHSSTKYLVKDKYVAKGYLQQQQKKRIKQAEKSFIDINTPQKWPDEEAELLEAENQQSKPKKMQMSNESAHFQMKKVVPNNAETDIKNIANKNDELNAKGAGNK